MASSPPNAILESIGEVKIDWIETNEEHIFKVNAPGSTKEDVNVEILHGNVLQISGDNNMKDEGMRGRWHLTERAHGKFLRTFQLPNDSNLKKFRTRDKNGVIIINIPKNLLVRTVVISDIPSYVLT